MFLPSISLLLSSIIFFRTTSVRARLQDESGDTEMGGDSARGETLLLRDTDQGHPGEGWVVRHRRREEEGEEVVEEVVVEEEEQELD